MSCQSGTRIVLGLEAQMLGKAPTGYIPSLGDCFPIVDGYSKMHIIILNMYIRYTSSR